MISVCVGVVRGVDRAGRELRAGGGRESRATAALAVGALRVAQRCAAAQPRAATLRHLPGTYE